MALAAGTRLGRYEVLSPLGAGGMGEVYRARDTQLGRDVAVKVVAEGTATGERLQRFEQEARAIAALQHAHVLAVHDVGSHECRPYLVFELLEGETLRERLSHGPLAPRKAIEITAQICDGLAAAHARGVIHRDLKPENVFLAREGGVKLLDFGLAKLLADDGDGASEAPTETGTDRGHWVGTPGYVSPEQVRGQGATARSDVFGLGAVLYEMLTGQRAFRGATKADTLVAILEKDPPPMAVPGGTVPPPLERIVLRCLEKDPDDRFQSARDVAFALEALSVGSRSESAVAAVVPARRARRLWWGVAILTGAVGIAGLAFVAGRRTAETPPPVFRQLTFRQGWVDYARFAPDGRAVVYGASWDGHPLELFQTRTDSPESRPLALARAKVLSISSQGEMAVLLHPSGGDGYFQRGTLAVVPLAGGTPRELLEGVSGADWTPDGRDLCVSRTHPDGRATVELPPGTALDWIPATRSDARFLRLSRDGRYIGYFVPGVRKIVLADRERRTTRDLVDPAPGSADFFGMAWAPGDREIWFTSGVGIGARDVHAVDLDGRTRLVYRSAGTLSLMDTRPDGRALFHRALDRYATLALLPGGRAEQDVTVYGTSFIGSFSADGRALLLISACEGVGPQTCTYLRRDGGEPVRVATGSGWDLSPDGRTALVFTDSGELSVVPIGPGLSRRVDRGPLRLVAGGRFIPSPSGGLILLAQEKPEDTFGLWVVDEGGSSPRKLGLDAFLGWTISPDGRQVAAKTAADTISIVPVAGGPRRELRVLDANLAVRRWSADGRALFLTLNGRSACEIHRLDLATEKIELWRRVAPPDPTGVIFCNGVLPSADGRSYVYTVNRSLASLIVAEGLR